MSFETDFWPYVPAKWQNRIDGKRKVRLVVMHSMEAPEKGNTAESVAHYFQTTDRPASAHICIDSDSTIQCVHDNDVAYAAPGVNRDGIHIEMAGFAKQTRAEWLDTYGLLMLERAADAAAQYCLKYDLPCVKLTSAELKDGKKGLIGHRDATAVYKPNAGHQDPGESFPWDWFVDRVIVNFNRRKAQQ